MISDPEADSQASKHLGWGWLPLPFPAYPHHRSLGSPSIGLLAGGPATAAQCWLTRCLHREPPNTHTHTHTHTHMHTLFLNVHICTLQAVCSGFSDGGPRGPCAPTVPGISPTQNAKSISTRFLKPFLFPRALNQSHALHGPQAPPPPHLLGALPGPALPPCSGGGFYVCSRAPSCARLWPLQAGDSFCSLLCPGG